eukprot:16159707-Heterocapsa_arctica.AAC.1
MIRSAIENPKAKPPAAPKVRTALPAHVLRGQANVADERSRSAPVPRPVPPPTKAPPDRHGNFVPLTKAPPDSQGNLVVPMAPSLMTKPPDKSAAKPLMAKPKTAPKARSTTPKPGNVIRRDVA